jgi:hypothetical protein
VATAIEPGKIVNIYDSTGSTVIAKGIVQEQIDSNYRDYRQTVTASRAIVKVTNVLVPCALIPIALSKVETNDKANRTTIIAHLSHSQDDILVYKKNLRPCKELVVSDVLPSSSSYQRDWTSMAEAWNIFVARREKANQNDVLKFYRKHAHMLESFFESGGKSNNIKATLQPHLKNIENLIEEHRFPSSAPMTGVSAPGPLATHGPNATSLENRDFSHMVSSIPLHLSNAPVLTIQTNGPLIYPGQLQQTSGRNTKKRSLDRAIQLCVTCGHYRQHNELYNDMHYGKCCVPENSYSDDRSVKGWCFCSQCCSGAEHVGYVKPVVVDISRRALKTCKVCGHYKHFGFYRDKHSKTECFVMGEPMTDIYVGFCSCEHCMLTAVTKGKEKPTKLRKT